MQKVLILLSLLLGVLISSAQLSFDVIISEGGTPLPVRNKQISFESKSAIASFTFKINNAPENASYKLFLNNENPIDYTPEDDAEQISWEGVDDLRDKTITVRSASDGATGDVLTIKFTSEKQPNIKQKPTVQIKIADNTPATEEAYIQAHVTDKNLIKISKKSLILF